MAGEYQVSGTNADALFTLKLHRGDGMVLLAMNWKRGTPPADFVGFAIEYKEPNGDKFYPLKNRLSFPGPGGALDPNQKSSRLSPIQKFRWVHFPRNAELDGEFVYKVSPVFMNGAGELSYGESQRVGIELRRETYPRQLNVAFTRGFVSSQAFVDRFAPNGDVSKLLPASADKALAFAPTHPQAEAALQWMGFEAREAVLDVLDRAIADRTAQVRVVAYDLNEPGILTRLEKLGPRLKVIIDDDGAHGERGSSENQAAKRLAASAGKANVKRQHMGKLQHNKTIVASGSKIQAVVCGSTNFSWRGFFVQNNNALVLTGASAVKPFQEAFDAYWNNDEARGFGSTASAEWKKLGLKGIRAEVAFSPHSSSNALLKAIVDDIRENVTSSMFYSLAFLYQTPGALLEAIKEVTADDARFVYGISDRKVGGLDLQKPNGNVAPVFPQALAQAVPEPFKSEPTGGGGVRMHHKFVVIDFDKPTARVYLGSYNFSSTADRKNGENLLLIRDRRVAVSFVVQALTMFDHYHFRIAEAEADAAGHRLFLKTPPQAGEEPWWSAYYRDPRKVRDRELFA
ncbi:MAG: phospholipase D-like domain-containing protein [Myxococcota bacterium]